MASPSIPKQGTPSNVEDARERDSKRLRMQQEANLETILQQIHPRIANSGLTAESLSEFPQILNQLRSFSGSSANINTMLGNNPVPGSDTSLNDLLKRLGLEIPSSSTEEMLESLRLANSNLKRDNDKKEYLIQDLLKKLHDALETIKLQTAQINELQMQQQSTSMHTPMHTPMQTPMQMPNTPVQMHHESGQYSPSPLMHHQMSMMHQPSPQMMHHHHGSPQVSHHALSPQMSQLALHSPQMPHHSPQMMHSSEEMYKISPQLSRSRLDSSFGPLELRVLQQPPNQAVYQRILRPFPTVAVLGVSSLGQNNNLFVEVSLLKQDEHDAQTFYQGVYPISKSNSPLEEKKNLIGGQLVQRSEAGSSPDSLVVVFRKLKILTTTAQQGGAFFLLKFVLKRYVDNSFETVPNVTCAISDPIEVFSHTLYLKGRPKTNSPSPRTAKRNASRAVKPEAGSGDNAAIAAATVLMNARAQANGQSTPTVVPEMSMSTNPSPPALMQSSSNLSLLSVSSIIPTDPPSLTHHGEDLSSLVAVSVGSE